MRVVSFADRGTGDCSASLVTRATLALTAFGVAVDVMISASLGGSESGSLVSSVALGLPLVSVTAWRILATGRFRAPSAPLLLLAAYTAWCAASVFWMTNQDAFISRLVTNAQLLVLVLLGWQLLLSERDLRATVAGFLAGCVTIVALTWQSFVAGTALHEGTRYAAASFDANDMSVTLALGIPMAAWLALAGQRWRDCLSLLYLPIAAGAIGLSGSRAGALTGSAVAIVVLWWIARHSFLRFALAVSLVFAGMAIALAVVPSENWARILTLREQVASGSVSGRTQIWRAGLDIIAQHPFLGVGAGGFRHAVVPALNKQMVAHSTVLSVAVDLGLIGLSLFAAALVAVWRGVERSGLRQRAFGRLLLFTWIIGSASLTWESRKATWLVLLIGAVLPVSLPKEDRER